ncbi:trypsin-like [Aphidius gifuensis]|nr:trypsin-like [Aphidius gifuensis]
MCGGVIISENHVLSAASCVLAEENVVYGNIQVLAGTHDITDYRNGLINQVSHVIYHELYNPRNNWINDIAILKLQLPLIVMGGWRSAYVSSIAPKSTYCHVTGWGKDPITNNLSRFLQRLKVRIISSSSCTKNHYKETNLSSKQHCFFPIPTSAGVSQGSGGSPVMYGRQILGIISLDSLDVNQPAIFTRIFRYVNWIERMKRKI